MAWLTVSVDARVVECAKRYAARHATSVSRLVACYLDLLTRPPSAADALPRWARRGATPDESSARVMRLARVVAIAEDALGSREKARRWLLKPNPALAGAVPLEQSYRYSSCSSACSARPAGRPKPFPIKRIMPVNCCLS